MRRMRFSALCLVAACSAAGSAFAADPSPRLESLGPLVRFEPGKESLPGLVAIHGNPRLGLPAEAGEQVERMGSGDSWCLETKGNLAVIGRNSGNGRLETREVISGVEPEWCFSPDGKLLFAERRNRADLQLRGECFDFASGKSLWTFEQGLLISDALFTPDGKQLVILHTMDRDGTRFSPAVSWYDAATGERVRRVKLPGFLYREMGVGSDYLGITGRSAHVAIPRENDVVECWTIPPGDGEPVKINLETGESTSLAQVRVGGADREFLAIYTDEWVELFREGEQGLTRLFRVDVASSRGRGIFRKCVRFSPDHKQLLVSDFQKTLEIPVSAGPEPAIRRVEGGFRLGDYTADGKALVLFDDGGGALLELATLKRVDRLELREVPAHCCPIEEAGFSSGGKWIISSDKHRLLLWSQEGELLAELASPNEEARSCLDLQSPLIVEKLLKIYAADGWDFIEWDLNEIAERRQRFPGIYPKVVGKVVFRDEPKKGDEPELMNVALDSSGTKLLTATRSVFRYRSLETPEKSVKLLVPRPEIAFSPRSIHVSPEDPDILVRVGSESFALDPVGKKKPERVNDYSVGVDMKHMRALSIDNYATGPILMSRPFGKSQTPDQKMTLPAAWDRHFYREMLVDKEGRWLILAHDSNMELPSLAVIDWQEKKLVREITPSWTTTSLSFSPDGSRLLVGSSNRAIYVFDMKKLCESAQ